VKKFHARAPAWLGLELESAQGNLFLLAGCLFS
jgi:hypothetical protein